MTTLTFSGDASITGDDAINETGFPTTPYGNTWAIVKRDGDLEINGRSYPTLRFNGIPGRVIAEGVNLRSIPEGTVLRVQLADVHSFHKFGGVGSLTAASIPRVETLNGDPYGFRVLVAEPVDPATPLTWALGGGEPDDSETFNDGPSVHTEPEFNVNESEEEVIPVPTEPDSPTPPDNPLQPGAGTIGIALVEPFDDETIPLSEPDGSGVAPSDDVFGTTKPSSVQVDRTTLTVVLVALVVILILLRNGVR